jgi:hypothetical protein
MILEITQEINDRLGEIERRSKGFANGELRRLIENAIERVLEEQLGPTWDIGALSGDPSILREMRTDAPASPAN